MMLTLYDKSDPQGKFATMADFLRKNPGVVMGPWRWRLPNPITDPMIPPLEKGPHRVRVVVLRSGKALLLSDVGTKPPRGMVEAHTEQLKDMAFSVLTEYALEQARRKAIPAKEGA